MRKSYENFTVLDILYYRVLEALRNIVLFNVPLFFIIIFANFKIFVRLKLKFVIRQIILYVIKIFPEITFFFPKCESQTPRYK